MSESRTYRRLGMSECEPPRLEKFRQEGLVSLRAVPRKRPDIRL
jgi:hypothetical protein